MANDCRVDPCGIPAAIAAGRTVLGWSTTEQIRGRRFSKVVVMGPYWSGTNAVREEIIWRFNAAVLNPDKLEVCAPTPEAVRSLREALTEGPVLHKAVAVGQRRVPRGYKLLSGPRNSDFLVRLLRAYRQQDAARKAASRAAAAKAPDNGHGNGDSPPDRHHGDKRRSRDTSGYHTEHSPLPRSSTEQTAVGSKEPTESVSEILEALEPPVTVSFGPDTVGACPWWKHAVRLRHQGEIDTDDDTLVVLVTKDPLFWLKSMSKHYYEIKAEGNSRAGLDALFGELEHERQRYTDAVALWNASMGSFLDEELYPSSRCVLLRYEDFLFRFWDVMVHLCAFLPAACQRVKEPPNSSRSKSHGKEVRGREEALRFYSSGQNRICDFTLQHRKRLMELDAAILQALGYESVPDSGVDANAGSQSDGVAVCTWVPELHPGDIVATRFFLEDWQAPGQDAANGSRESSVRAYARVVSRVSRDEAEVDLLLLKLVPREWLVGNDHDWAVAEWPAAGPPRGACPQLRRAVSEEQRVPRSWVDLRVPCCGSSGSALPLTEEGYRMAVSLRSTSQLADMVTRIIADLEVNGLRAGKVLDRRRLLGFARWFSGEANIQSLAQIRIELPAKEAENWVTFAPPRPTRCLDLPAPTAAPDQPEQARDLGGS
eukprot:gnl/TRDRNA2_/TRDRNA2_73316_c0_seq2.p1 gnl/TRDRNA2_/TRDRNA2_73316_c0~~gnl/TRDRNA2_/TRDRNA2_73316_c0_seq2.p1  ORF type:complete len:671 (+),score=92.77 gnl/TRDRNA2_/TRDRNA2_73316_c0_seq2:46-2013(+)